MNSSSKSIKQILIFCKRGKKAVVFQYKYVYLPAITKKRHCFQTVGQQKSIVTTYELLTKQATFQPFLQYFSFLVGAIRNYHLFRCR